MDEHDVDFLDCMERLTAKVQSRFPGVAFELQGANDATVVGWFRLSDPARLQVMVVIDFNGAATIATGEGLVIELYVPSRDPDEIVSQLWSHIAPLGESGVELVRTCFPLGRLSPSFVGPPDSDEILRAKRRRLARVVASAGGWR